MHSSRSVPQGKPIVLALGGQARSGSTLLDRALGQIPGFCSVGEVRHLWERGLRDNQLCGCGAPLRTCEFWTGVGEHAFGGWSRLDLDDVVDLRRSVDRAGNLALLGAPSLSASFTMRLHRYASYLARVYAGIGAVSGARVVIDSTMSPSHVLVLRRLQGINLRLVHLVRDSRGVAHSSMKKVRRPEVTQGIDYMPTYTPPVVAGRWMATNMAIELVRRRVPSVRVRYESFVRSPSEVLIAVAAIAGETVGAPALGFVSGNEVELGIAHTAAGNPMRFKVGLVPLRLDEAWRGHMRPRDRWLVTALTAPLLARYGYL